MQQKKNQFKKTRTSWSHFFNCADYVEPFQCHNCPNFQIHLRHHRLNHDPKEFNEQLNRCTKCHFETYSKYVLLRRTFYNKCNSQIQGFQCTIIQAEAMFRWNMYLKMRFSGLNVSSVRWDISWASTRGNMWWRKKGGRGKKIQFKW